MRIPAFVFAGKGNAMNAATGKLIASLQKQLKAKTMTQKQATELIQEWIDQGLALEAQFKALEAIVGDMAESPLWDAVWKGYDAHRRAIAALMGDGDEWLSWFQCDCDYGRTPREMVFPNGEVLLVVGASDLTAAILTDADGNRVFENAIGEARDQ